MLMKLNKK